MSNLENIENIINNDTDIDSGKDTNKTFTQEDVDRIVQERLSREKNKYTDYDDLQELSIILDELDYSGLTIAEKKALLKQQAEEYKKQKEQQEYQEIEDEAIQKNIDPELYKTINELKEKVKKFEDKEIEENNRKTAIEKAKENTANQIKEFQEKYIDIDIETLVKQPKFKKFFNASNPNLSLIQVYEEYTELIGDEKEINNSKLNSQRSTFGGNSGGVKDKSFGLTENQKMIADESGISYERYAKILNSKK